MFQNFGLGAASSDRSTSTGALPILKFGTKHVLVEIGLKSCGLREASSHGSDSTGALSNPEVWYPIFFLIPILFPNFWPWNGQLTKFQLNWGLPNPEVWYQTIFNPIWFQNILALEWPAHTVRLQLVVFHFCGAQYFNPLVCSFKCSVWV